MDSNNGGDSPLTIEILRSIRDEIAGLRGDTNARFGETNARLDQTNARLDETNERLDRTNERLDFVAQGQIRMANEIHEVRDEVRKLNLRFDNFLVSPE